MTLERVRVFGSVMLLWAGLMAFAGEADARKSLNDLTGPWQLFVDDYLVSHQSGLKRTYHAFEKYPDNPVLKADKPWEGQNVYVYGTILPNESGPGYRMWYHALPETKGDDPYRLLYATSQDGIRWDKPDLGLFDYEGSKHNNIFIRRNPREHIPSVIHTPWDASPERQYALINYSVDGYYLAWSPDGIHWKDAPKNPVLTEGADVGNFCWDPWKKKFVGYVKLGSVVKDLKRRSVAFTSSADLLSWLKPELIIVPDEVDDRWATSPARTQFYGFSVFPYETMYLGFLWLYRSMPTKQDPEGYMDGIIYVELASSRDGVHWTRMEGDRPPILALGPEGSWDDGMLTTPNHPLVEGDKIRLYYGGIDGTHYARGGTWTSSIGLAFLRKDGFASMDAGLEPGDLTTKELTGASGRLHLNFSAPNGSIKVELLDARGVPISGYERSNCVPVQGDSVDQIVTWKENKDLPKGTDPIRLRFILQGASLYSFRTDSDVSLAESPDSSIPASVSK